MFKPTSPYDIYFRYKSIIWPTLLSRMDKTVFEATTLRVCVCVSAYVCDVSMSLNLKYLTIWLKRKIVYKPYSSGGYQNLVVINPLQSVTKVWRKRELTRLNNTINIHF